MAIENNLEDDGRQCGRWCETTWEMMEDDLEDNGRKSGRWSKITWLLSSAKLHSWTDHSLNKQSIACSVGPITIVPWRYRELKSFTGSDGPSYPRTQIGKGLKPSEHDNMITCTIGRNMAIGNLFWVPERSSEVTGSIKRLRWIEPATPLGQPGGRDQSPDQSSAQNKSQDRCGNIAGSIQRPRWIAQVTKIRRQWPSYH